VRRLVLLRRWQQRRRGQTSDNAARSGADKTTGRVDGSSSSSSSSKAVGLVTWPLAPVAGSRCCWRARCGMGGWGARGVWAWARAGWGRRWCWSNMCSEKTSLATSGVVIASERGTVAVVHQVHRRGRSARLGRAAEPVDLVRRASSSTADVVVNASRPLRCRTRIRSRLSHRSPIH